MQTPSGFRQSSIRVGDARSPNERRRQRVATGTTLPPASAGRVEVRRLHAEASLNALQIIRVLRTNRKTVTE